MSNLHSSIALVVFLLPFGLLPEGAQAIEERVNACKCAAGFVWREADAQDFVCVTPDMRALVASENVDGTINRVSATDNTCKSGFVWRDAFDGDGVCVSPAARDRVHQENREHTAHLDPACASQ
jgi:hypothetical protein